jgi:hypothetical protein
MIGYYLGMHHAGVLLILLVLVLLLVTRAIGVNRPYLSRNANQQRNSACDYG